MKRFIRIFIQATYIILFLITSLMMIHAIDNNYAPSTISVVLYIISTFLSMGKVIYCLYYDYINQ